LLTVKLCVAEVAPVAVAVIEQVPVATSLTRPPEVLQTVVVVEARVTGSLGLDEAAIGKGELPRI
jgi:hypothetical protein